MGDTEQMLLVTTQTVSNSHIQKEMEPVLSTPLSFFPSQMLHVWNICLYSMISKVTPGLFGVLSLVVVGECR